MGIHAIRAKFFPKITFGHPMSPWQGSTVGDTFSLSRCQSPSTHCSLVVRLPWNEVARQRASCLWLKSGVCCVVLCFLLFLKWTHLSWRGIHLFWVWNPSWATRTMELEDVFLIRPRGAPLWNFKHYKSRRWTFVGTSFFFKSSWFAWTKLTGSAKRLRFRLRKLNMSKRTVQMVSIMKFLATTHLCYI